MSVIQPIPPETAGHRESGVISISQVKRTKRHRKKCLDCAKVQRSQELKLGRLTSTCSHVSDCTSSCRIPLKLRSSRKSSWPRCPSCALLSSVVPLLPQGQPDPNVTSSFACRARRSPNLSVRRRNGAVQAGLCFPRAPPRLGVAAARVAVLQAVTTGGWKGSSPRVRKQGRRKCACTRTRRKKVFPKHPAMHSLIFE